MAATLTRLARTLPLPLFGSAQTAASFTLAKSRILPRLLGWTVPLTIGGLWFVWPAVDDGWKIEMGFMSDPEAALAAASSSSSGGEGEKKVELSEEAQAKVENAYKAHEVEVTEDDKLLAKAADSGDFTYLEEKWEEFNEKAIRPGEDDDDDDDDDDEDDEEEDEEEDEE